MTIRSYLRVLGLSLALGVGFCLLEGCKKEEPAPTVETIEDKADDVGDHLEDAGEAIKEGAEEVGEDLKDAAESVVE